jgi:CheY-like chemotaxis protein
MSRILAIEADPTRRTLLRALVREHVDAQLMVVESVRSAIDELGRRIPDVILAPTLLSPADGAELVAFVRELTHAPYVQLMTVPAFDMLAEPQSEQKRPFGLFKRRTAHLGPQYDRAMVGAQIADGLARAREARMDYATALARQAELEDAAQYRLRQDLQVSPSGLVLAGGALMHQTPDERRVALRRHQGDIPWLSSARLAWGTEIALVNISSSGVLLESGSKLAPGSATELYLSGPETNLVVPVRFIRSEIARIDGLGVKYHAAGAFGREIDLAGPRRVPERPSSPPHALAALLAATLADSQASDPAHLRFVRGLRELVGARDVQIRNSPGTSGRETLYFEVPGDDRARTTLQVVFDRGHDVTPAEFTLLKAAAWLTAAAFELEKPVVAPGGLLEEQVA